MARNLNLTLQPKQYLEITTQGKYKQPKMVARKHYPNEKQTIRYCVITFLMMTACSLHRCVDKPITLLVPKTRSEPIILRTGSFTCWKL